jgi:fused signal recognition particle receptor
VAFFDKITQGLTKTRDTLFGQVATVFQRGRELSDEDYETLEAALLRADVGPATTDKLIQGVRDRLADSKFEGDARDALRAEIETVLTVPDSQAPNSTPHVILVVGVNGSGKTTTIAKLADRFKREGNSVLLVACDTFRAAAADQLEIWAERAGVEIVKQKPGADPAAVAFDGMARAKSRGATRVLVDTAGRLHVKVNLMEEMKKIRRVIEQQIPGAPQEVLLVLDATTGQNGLNQAREFGTAVGVTELALTKLDGSAKGGVALAIADTLKLPIRWVGVGEGMEDLIPFEPAAFAEALTRA